jgi:hypothetical protein
MLLFETEYFLLYINLTLGFIKEGKHSDLHQFYNLSNLHPARPVNIGSFKHKNEKQQTLVAALNE